MLNKKDTRQILVESLIELSQTKPIEKISVCDIVRNCGAGRQTFYNHFKDKYDLINWFYNSTVDNIIEQYKDKGPWADVIGLTISFIYEYRKFFGNVISEEGQESFFNAFYEHTKHFYTEYVRSNYGEAALTEELLFDIKFNCHGAVCMDKEWLKSGMKEPPTVIGTRIANAMPQSLKKYFE
ncbi:MAG TPA: TetR/AcrR family transcriptional regulator C-terminal domain-containing protein [Anaerovoracaceae bacterium]|nr:TetR/AcrR family transcriptional regulator C-terminal domain-containing protein [Anaerovoracaceae bacterium]